MDKRKKKARKIPSLLMYLTEYSERLAIADAPCTMCVQYIGGGGVFSTSGRYHEYIGGIS